MKFFFVKLQAFSLLVTVKDSGCRLQKLCFFLKLLEDSQEKTCVSPFLIKLQACLKVGCFWKHEFLHCSIERFIELTEHFFSKKISQRLLLNPNKTFKNRCSLDLQGSRFCILDIRSWYQITFPNLHFLNETTYDYLWNKISHSTFYFFSQIF